MRIRILFLLLGLLWLPLLVGAQENWAIDDFRSDIAIGADGVVMVTETITADFGNIAKHGIIRNLPYIYEKDDGGRTNTIVSDISVLQDGQQAEIDITKSNGYMNVRIGDPDKTITGAHAYEITYAVAGVLQSFERFDELNWNVTGNDWDVPIGSARATVTVPAEILQAACYKGSFGANTECDALDRQENAVMVSANNLRAGEGLTVAVGFTSGVVPIIEVPEPPSLLGVMFSRGAVGSAIVLAVLGIGLLLRHGYSYGRDRYWQRAHLPGERSDREGHDGREFIVPLLHRQPVSPEYEAPDGLRPAEVGVLLDEKADTLDVSATIVDLASRGFLEITEVPKTWIFGQVDYAFTRTEKSADTLLKYEAALLEYLFDDGKKVSMSDLKQTFYKDLQKVKVLLYEEVVNKKLFPANPDNVRKKYIGFGVALDVLAIALFFGLVTWLQNSLVMNVAHQLLGGLAVALLVTGFATQIVSSYMPRKTAYGRELYQRVLGYDMFISSTEKYRAKFMENEGLFMEVLPYAIVFGVTDKLAKAFKKMGIEPPAPAWYHGSTPFHAAVFASHMSSFSSSLGTAMASAPSSSGSGGSSGGGFSGGGFGGGGGSSW